MRKLILLGAATALLAVQPASAGLKVFACEPEWGALSKELGGDLVSIYVATTGLQDIHQVQARPSLIAKARSADISVCTGAELEISWMPLIQQQSANPKILPGAPGNFEAARYVQLLDQPVSIDRSQGDIHPFGNPHIQTDARNILLVAKPLAESFATLDPANAAAYRERYASFETRWNAAVAKWQTAAAPLRGKSIAVQHKSWPYLTAWLGLVQVIALEPKPGVPPSSGYLAEVIRALQAQPAKVVIRAAYEDSRSSEFIAGRIDITPVLLPSTVGGTEKAKDLFSLYDEIVGRLLEGFAQ